MPQVLSSFLVGIGYDYDEKGEKQIESGIDSIKSKALQLGAVVAGAFGIKALTADFADANDRIGKFGQVFGVVPNDVAALGRALEHEGGSLDSLMQQLEGIERLRAGLLRGDAEFIAQAGIAGINADAIIDAKNATEAYIALADQFQRLNQKQRLNAAEALGLDEASIRLLSYGSGELRNVVEYQKQLRPLTAEMTAEAARFNDAMQDLRDTIGGVADRASMKLLPAISDNVEGMASWIQQNREFINLGLDTVLDPIANNIDKIAAALVLITSSSVLAGVGTLAKRLPVIGAGTAAAASGLAKTGVVGAAAVGGYVAGTEISERALTEEQKLDIGRTVAVVMAFLGSDEAQRAIDAEISAGGFTPGYSRGRNEQLLRGVASDDAGQPRTGQTGGGQPVQVNLVLDGQVIDSHIIKVMERVDKDVMDEIDQSVGG